MDRLERVVLDTLDESFLRGSRFSTRRDHAQRVLARVATALDIDLQAPYDRERDLEQQQLARILDSNTVPRTGKEWKRLVAKYCSTHVNRRELYRHMAIDGFRGENPSAYLVHVTEYLQTLPLQHVRAVRSLYDELNEGPLKQLPGPDTACVVFMALLRFYGRNLDVHDDLKKMTMQRAYVNAEGTLHGNAHYYRDSRIIDEQLLDGLGEKYRASFENDEQWQHFAEKLLDWLAATYWNGATESSNANKRVGKKKGPATR